VPTFVFMASRVLWLACKVQITPAVSALKRFQARLFKNGLSTITRAMVGVSSSIITQTLACAKHESRHKPDHNKSQRDAYDRTTNKHRTDKRGVFFVQK